MMENGNESFIIEALKNENEFLQSQVKSLQAQNKELVRLIFKLRNNK